MTPTDLTTKKRFPLRIYVAGKWERKELTRDVQSYLKKQGHFITHDWTCEDANGLTGAAYATYVRECAKRDVAGVKESDVLVVLADPNAYGTMVEMGVAISMGIPVLVCMGKEWRESPFFFLDNVQVFETIEELYGVVQRISEALGKYEP